MRYLTWIVTVPVALVAILFAISNRATVTLSLWPLPFTLEAPLYLAALLALVVGFLAGGFVVWNSQRRHRRRARRSGDRVVFLEREVKEAQARAYAAEKRIAELSRPVSGTGLTVAPGSAGGSAGASGTPTVH